MPADYAESVEPHQQSRTARYRVFPGRFAAILLFLISGSVHAAEPLTLDEAVTTAVKNHPLIAEAKANLQGAEARTGQALANYYPQINISADWSKGRSYFAVRQSVLNSEATSDALYLKQNIYDFGRTAGAVEAARWNSKAAADSLAVTRQDLAFRVRSDFYLLLAAEKQVIAIDETVKAREAIFRQAGEFFNHGVRAKVDVARAESNLYAAKTSLIRAKNNRDLAMLELANALGIPSLGNRPLAEPLGKPLSALLAASVTKSERVQLATDALANRAELKRLAALENSADAALKTAKSGYLPVLSGVASVGYADKDFPPGSNVWGVGLNLTLPLFSGFATVEQVKEAVALRSAVQAQQQNQRLQIVKEVESAWLAVEEASARMVSTQKESAAADESRTLAEGRYLEGVGSIIEVTDAQSQSLDANTAQIQANYDYETALAQLDRAAGRD
jgi:outer membrane protein